MRGWQANLKRTCASPEAFRAMPENEKPPAMRGDLYCFAGSFDLDEDAPVQFGYPAVRGRVGDAFRKEGDHRLHHPGIAEDARNFLVEVLGRQAVLPGDHRPHGGGDLFGRDVVEVAARVLRIGGIGDPRRHIVESS